MAAQVGATAAELQARLGHSTSVAAQLYKHAAKDRDRQIAELHHYLLKVPNRLQALIRRH